MISSRRAFLKIAALGGASLVVAFDRRRLLGAGKEAAGQFKPNGWVRVDGDGTVTLTIGKSEMGQGVRTSLAMILADELEADWSRIKLVQASPGPDFKRLGTGGSFSLAGSGKLCDRLALLLARCSSRRPPRGGKLIAGLVLRQIARLSTQRVDAVLSTQPWLPTPPGF